MADLFLLSEAQMRRIEGYFPLSHGPFVLRDQIALFEPDTDKDAGRRHCRE
jgi:hypothetical protein